MEGWEETQPEQVTQSDQRDILDHVTSSSIHKVGGKKEEGEDICSVVVFLRHCYIMEMADELPCSWEAVN